MLNKKISMLAAGSLIITSAVVAGTASAQTLNGANAGVRPGMQGGTHGQRGTMPGARLGQGVSGKVTAINGTSITVQSSFGKETKTYAVDASKATFSKNAAPVNVNPGSGTGSARPTPTTIAITDIAVGDTVAVRGTVNGDNIAATAVTVMPGMAYGRGADGGFANNVISGTVQSASGSTLTVLGDGKFMMGRAIGNGATTEKTQVVYTVDASAATVKKVTHPSDSAAKATETVIALSDIKAGDTVRVQGKIDGTNIKADSIVDGVLMRGPSASAPAFEKMIENNDQAKSLKTEIEAVKPGLWTKVMGFFSGLLGRHR